MAPGPPLIPLELIKYDDSCDHNVNSDIMVEKKRENEVIYSKKEPDRVVMPPLSSPLKLTPPKGRIAVLGMSPGFKTDVVRMDSVRELHKGDYEVITISEHPTVEGHLCTDFSSARGWNTILEGFFNIVVLDYSWIQRDYFYTNYGGKKWFFDKSVPHNTGFIKRFFEWNGQVVILPLDERGDVWKEFCHFQKGNKFEFQLLMHEVCPLVQASRKAENEIAWVKEIPKEFQCKTDRNQRRYLRADAIEDSAESEIDDEDINTRKLRNAAQATHIAFVNGQSGFDALEHYIIHGKDDFERMSTNYSNPTGKAPPSTVVRHTSAEGLTQPVVSLVKWVQCDKCSKWRGIPNHVDLNDLPDEWYCEMNQWDEEASSCSAAEASWDEFSYITPPVPTAMSLVLPPPVPVEEMTNHSSSPCAIPSNDIGVGEMAVGKIPLALPLPVSQEEPERPADIAAIYKKIPRNFPPAEIPAKGSTAFRRSTNMSSRTKRTVGGIKRGNVVNAKMEIVPPAGSVIVDDWVQCEDVECEKWHIIGPGVLETLKDVVVTCGTLGLVCSKGSAKKMKIKEGDLPSADVIEKIANHEYWEPCAFDEDLVKCLACGRLSYRRHAMGGKACQCRNEK